MDNVGKALTMAGFTLLFIFAASAAIYLYGTVFAYLQEGAFSTEIGYRAESATTEDLSNYQRTIDGSEVFLSLYNMKQMHIDVLCVKTSQKSGTVTQNDDQASSNFKNVLSAIKTASTFTYSFQYDANGKITVTYTGKG